MDTTRKEAIQAINEHLGAALSIAQSLNEATGTDEDFELLKAIFETKEKATAIATSDIFV